MNSIKSIVFGVLMLAMGVGRAANYYVIPSGNDANNGTSWALAKKTIQAAVNISTSNDVVLVTNGTYALTDQISINPGIVVRSVNGMVPTILLGGGTNGGFRCVYVHTNASLDGFTVTNGCRYDVYSYGFGGGVYNEGGTVQNCTVSGNTADWGGGVYNSAGSVHTNQSLA